MIINKFFLISCLSTLVFVLLLISLPATISIPSLLLSALTIGGFYFYQNYPINYKYWRGFALQFIGLICITASFFVSFSFLLKIA